MSKHIIARKQVIVHSRSFFLQIPFRHFSREFLLLFWDHVGIALTKNSKMAKTVIFGQLKTKKNVMVGKKTTVFSRNYQHFAYFSIAICVFLYLNICCIWVPSVDYFFIESFSRYHQAGMIQISRR